MHVQVYGTDAETLYDRLSKNGSMARKLHLSMSLTVLQREGIAERRIVGPDTINGTGADLKRRTSPKFGPDNYLTEQIRGFTLEFRLPHNILRPGQANFKDRRGLRKYRSFLPPRPDDNDCLYEAQLFLIVFGVDDYFWSAFFYEDSFFSKKNITANYLQGKLDLHSDFGCGEIDEESLEKFLEDEPSLRKTEEYAWTLGTLRRLRNSLARLIATWSAFDMNNSVYFDLDADGSLYDKIRECFYQIHQLNAELTLLQMVLTQQIEMLEKMSGCKSRESLLNDAEDQNTDEGKSR
ncbi:hypothetical protein BBP40_011470 [Aspergillus hancockii]|nr:hypothetical protein BBP40_011470 [Aspergillus hancockii]